jgi:phasin family protein
MASASSTPNPFDPFDFFGQWQDLLTKGVIGSSANPFDPFGLLRAAPVDFSKAFDPFQVARTLTGFKAPGADIQTVMDGQQKNLEALQKAQQVAFSGTLALLQRQADMLRETLEEVARTTQEAAKGASPEDITAKQAAAFQAAMDRGFAILRELTELIAKGNSETFEVINKRFAEGVTEIRGIASSFG